MQRMFGDEVRIGITVIVNGAVMTGTLAPMHEYLEALSEQFATGLSPTIAQAEGRRVFRDAFGVDEAKRAHEQAKDAGAPLRTFRYLHLVNARVMSGTSLVPTGDRGVPVRIRVDHISAWSLGALQDAS